MRKTLYLFLFTLLLTSSLSSLAQQFKQFTADSEIYLEEMKDLFARSETHYKKGKDLLDNFEEPWLEGGISTNRKERIYEISNLLLKKRARNFPHFYDYLNLLLIFKQKGIDSVDYHHWELGLYYLLQNKKVKLNQISSYFQWAEHLMLENTISYSASVKWYTDNNKYSIRFENDTIKLSFDKLNLTGKLRNDSLNIYKTAGTYFPFTKIWKGNGALITWEKSGIGKDTTWAELDDYSFSMKKSTYSFPNVKFYHKLYFDYPILGTITDKIVEARSPNALTYPRFESNDSRFYLKGIANNIDYQGGFSMKGNRFLGMGTYYNPAMLKLYRDVELIEEGDTVIKKVLFIQTKSLHYAFQNGDITSVNAQVSLYVDEDSIFHPGLLFKYDQNKHQVDLIREASHENKAKSPYYDTYHNLELDFELLKWPMDDTDVEITMLQGTSINVAKFESTDYFSASRYYEIQGIETYHPYVLLRRYARVNNTDFVHAHDFAKYTRLPITPIRRLFIDLSYKGILEYDTESEIAIILPKMYKYLDAMVGKTDYDLIIFNSTINAPQSNATLNLKNMDLEIRGVPEINVSDSQNVIFYPSNQEILFKKNRDFDFSGRIEAGFFTFYGDNFQFRYDSFLVALNQVDSLSIKVKSGVDNWGRRILENVESVIEDITGDLVIDEAGNKSGIKSNPEFPTFNSKKNSFVYYDDKTIQKGKYTRDRFFFIVDPYKIDSLNDYTTEGMGYSGHLHSSDIFPTIKQLLTLQPDYSLGFEHQTPSQGLPAYKGKGQYYATIHLSNQGLRGDGELTYITSKTNSDDFIFYPDSTNVITTKFTIAKLNDEIQYPDVNTDKAYVHWMPYLDHLKGQTIESPFSMYENQNKHIGQLEYTPKHLIGSGNANYYKSKLSAELITYNANRFNSDTANFELQSKLSDSLAFDTKNVDARVSFIDMKTNFRANNDSAEVNLYENLYLAYVQQFSWLMKEDKMQLLTPNTAQVVEFGKVKTVSREEAGLPPAGSLFISTHSGQDSLQWVSPIADFNLKTNIISAHEVKYINTADARVFPNNEEVVLKPMARLETFIDARVLANTDTRHHNFHDATINISSRKRYSGEGYYNYEDELGRLQPISFDLIAVDSIGNTFGRGKVLGINDFTLSPAFNYKGNVSLYAPNEFLNFDGTAKMNHECDDQIAESWIKFNNEIDPNEIYIPIEENPQNINEQYLVSGPMVATDSVHLFPAFLSPWKKYSNVPIVSTHGFLHYDSKNKMYKLASKDKLQNNDTVGNLLSLHKNFCFLYGEGDINLTADLGQVKVITKGNSNYNLPENDLRLELLMTVDFFFPEKCFKYISDTLQTMSALRPTNIKGKVYQKALKELIGYTEAEQLTKELSVFGSIKKMPEPLNTTFVFTDLKLKWNSKQRAWQSDGEFGIANINGVQINKKVKGNIEIERKRSGDSFTLYLVLGEGHWYFFNYKRGLMQAYSSEGKFNTIITNIKGADRKQEVERGETSFVFFLSNMKKRNDFIKHLDGKEIKDSEDEFDDDDEDLDQYEEFD